MYVTMYLVYIRICLTELGTVGSTAAAMLPESNSDSCWVPQSSTLLTGAHNNGRGAKDGSNVKIAGYAAHVQGRIQMHTIMSG